MTKELKYVKPVVGLVALVAAAATLAQSAALAAGNGIPRPTPYGQPPAKNELRLPPPPPPAPRPSTSGYIRPFVTGNGGVGAVGGVQHGNTAVDGNIHVPPSGPPSAQVTVTHNPLPPPAHTAQPSVNLDQNKR